MTTQRNDTTPRTTAGGAQRLLADARLAANGNSISLYALGVLASRIEAEAAEPALLDVDLLRQALAARGAIFYSPPLDITDVEWVAAEYARLAAGDKGSDR